MAVSAILTSCVSGKEKDLAVKGITLDPEELYVSIGFTKPIAATVTPENADYLFIVWESSDPSVAQVSKRGTVKGISEGTATVTASVGSVKSTCLVHVGNRFAAVTGVTISPKTLTVGVKGTGELSAELAPEDCANLNVTWSSSNTSIATVDAEGVVTGVSEGECDITVTTEDGGFTDKCHVIVKIIPLERLYFFNGGENTIVAAQGSTQTLLVAFEPENASLTDLTWTTDDPSLATAEAEGEAQGKVTFASGKIGPVVVTATAGDGSSVSQSFFVKGEEDLYNAPSGKIYAGKRVKYSFNSAYYTEATNVRWQVGDKTISGSEAEFAFPGGGENSVLLSAEYAGKPIRVTFPVRVEEFFLNVNLEDTGVNPRNTYPVFNKEGTKAYFITRGKRRLYELDLTEGRLGWVFAMEDDKQDNGGDICVNPATGDIICSNQTHVFCVRPDGTTRWSIDVSNDVAGARLGSSGTPTSSFYGCGPAMSNDCAVLFVPIVEKFFALNAATGEIIDSFSNGNQGHIQFAVYGANDLVIHYDKGNGSGAIRFAHFDGTRFSVTEDIDSPLTADSGSVLTDICAPAINRDQSIVYFSGRFGKVLAVNLKTRSVIGVAQPAPGSGDAYIMQPVLTPDGRMVIPTQINGTIMVGNLSQTFTSPSMWTTAYSSNVTSIFNFMVPSCDTEGNTYFFTNGGAGGVVGFCRLSRDNQMDVIAPLPAKIDQYQAVFNFCDGYLVAGGGHSGGKATILIRCIDARRAPGWSGAGGDWCATKNANLVWAN